MFGRNSKKDIERVMAMGQNVKDHAGGWNPYAAVAQEAHLSCLDRELREKAEKVRVSVEILRAEASTAHEGFRRLTDGLSAKVSELTEALRQICPHKQVKYVESYMGDTWVTAAFTCILCGAELCYEDGPGSDDDMPPRFRRILEAMGIPVPKKEKK